MHAVEEWYFEFGYLFDQKQLWRYIEILFAALSLSSDEMVTGRKKVIPMVSLPMIATHSLRVKLNTCLHHCSVPSNPILGSGKFFWFPVAVLSSVSHLNRHITGLTSLSSHATQTDG